MWGCHDLSGNMTTSALPGEEDYAHLLVYDAWNRLVKVIGDYNDGDGVQDEGEYTLAVYEYDGLKRRIKKHVDTWDRAHDAADGSVDVWRHFYYNRSWQVIELRDGTASENTAPETLPPVQQFVWSQQYIDSPVLRDKNTDGTTDDACDDNRLCFLTDANMNVTKAVQDYGVGGTVVESYTYTPYGAVTSSGTAQGTQPLFCGYWHDAETGMYHVRNRMYNPSYGRWGQRDPAGYVDGGSLYTYCMSNPLTLYDFYGLAAQGIPTPPGSRFNEQVLPKLKSRIAWVGDAVDNAAEHARKARKLNARIRRFKSQLDTDGLLDSPLTPETRRRISQKIKAITDSNVYKEAVEKVKWADGHLANIQKVRDAMKLARQMQKLLANPDVEAIKAEFRDLAIEYAEHGLKDLMKVMRIPGVYVTAFTTGLEVGSGMGNYIAQGINIMEDHARCKCCRMAATVRMGKTVEWKIKMSGGLESSTCWRHSSGHVYAKVLPQDMNSKNDGFIKNIFDLFGTPKFVWKYCGEGI